MTLVWINLLCQKKKKSWIKDERARMSERACRGRVLCLCGKKKKRGIEGSGSFTRVGRETSLRESFRHSKRRVGVKFPSPLQGSVSQANSSSDLPSCTHLCDGSRMRCSHLLGSLCWLLALTSGKSYSSCFHTDEGRVIFFHVFHGTGVQLDVRESEVLVPGASFQRDQLALW